MSGATAARVSQGVGVRCIQPHPKLYSFNAIDDRQKPIQNAPMPALPGPIVVRFQSAAGPMPKHARLRQVIIDAVEAGELPVGSKLAGERELSQSLGLSLGTTQKALGRLMDEGFLERRQGHGTFVGSSRQPISGSWHFRFVPPEGGRELPVFATVLERRLETGDGPWQAVLGPDHKGYVMMRRSLDIGGKFTCTSQIYLPASRFGRLLRTVLSCFASALAPGVIIVGRFGDDAIGTLFELVFERSQRDDIEVAFTTAMPASVTSEIAHLPGVRVAEGRRIVPVRVLAGQRYRDVVLEGHADAPSLRSIPQWPMRPFDPPVAGVALSRKLAELLGVSRGGQVELEVLEGDRRSVRVVVTALLDDVFGLSMHASLATLRRLLAEEGNVTSVLLLLDPSKERELLERLSKIPRVMSIARRSETVAKFTEQTRHMWVTMAILTGMGATIAFGVVYNQARIALSTRSRDLASLRVLGFTRREISTILLSELAAYLVIGIPVGFVVGSVLMDLVAHSADPESYRLPVHASASTFAFAAVVTTAAAAISALLVRRRLDELDLVAVLKARE